MSTVDITLPPYAIALGMRVQDDADGGSPVVTYDYSDNVMGRPGYLHGGAIAGLLEVAAHAAIRKQLKQSTSGKRIKPINVSVEYIRGGTEKPTFASGKVTRLGKRVATVEAIAWQDDQAKPIASARINMLLSE